MALMTLLGEITCREEEREEEGGREAEREREREREKEREREILFEVGTVDSLSLFSDADRFRLDDEFRWYEY